MSHFQTDSEGKRELCSILSSSRVKQEKSQTDGCDLSIDLHPFCVTLQEVAADAQGRWSQVKGHRDVVPVLSDLDEPGVPVCKRSREREEQLPQHRKPPQKVSAGPWLHWSRPFFSAHAGKTDRTVTIQPGICHPTVHTSICPSSIHLLGLTARGEGLAVVEPLPLLRHRQGQDGDSVLGSEGELRERVRPVHLPQKEAEKKEKIIWVGSGSQGGTPTGEDEEQWWRNHRGRQTWIQAAVSLDPGGQPASPAENRAGARSEVYASTSKLHWNNM